jgi:hypothetical protein
MFKTRKNDIPEQIHEVSSQLQTPLTQLASEQLTQLRNTTDQLRDLLQETQEQWSQFGEKELKQFNKVSGELVKLLDNEKKRLQATVYAFKHPKPRNQSGLLALALLLGLAIGYGLRMWASSNGRDMA